MRDAVVTELERHGSRWKMLSCVDWAAFQAWVNDGQGSPANSPVTFDVLLEYAQTPAGMQWLLERCCHGEVPSMKVNQAAELVAELMDLSVGDDEGNAKAGKNPGK